MKDYEKIIKKMIISLIFIGIVIIFLIIILNNKMEDGDYSAEEELGIVKETEFKDVVSPSMYYTVKNLVDTYLNYIHLDCTKETPNERIQTLAEEYEIYDEQQKLTEILKILDVNYIKENNITIDNLENFIEIDNDEILDTNIVRMKGFEGDQFQFYIINIEVETEMSKKYNEYYVISMDGYNTTWMIRPIKDCNNIDEIEVNRNIESIENETEFEYERITNGRMASIYFNEYKEIMEDNYQEAYQRLDEEYRNKRFGNCENFKKYIESNIDEIRETYVDEYIANDEEEYTEYICKDSYGNIYTFKATSVSNYTVKLDTYTITSETFKEEYNESDMQNKVMMNIDKWIKMLNNRDYTTAYSVLDETFRNNNFNGNVSAFESYIRNKCSSHYTVKYKGFTKKTETIYSQDIILTKIEDDEGSEIEMKILIKIEDDMDFVISFDLD